MKVMKMMARAPMIYFRIDTKSNVIGIREQEIVYSLTLACSAC